MKRKTLKVSPNSTRKLIGKATSVLKFDTSMSSNRDVILSKMYNTFRLPHLSYTLFGHDNCTMKTCKIVGPTEHKLTEALPQIKCLTSITADG